MRYAASLYPSFHLPNSNCFSMPIVPFQTLMPIKIALWHITEDATELADDLPLEGQELADLASMSPKRRVASLAARRLIQELTGTIVPCSKDDNGKPILPNSDWQISYSHSVEYAAAIVAKKTVGIDIQQILPKITRIVPRLLNQAENECILPDNYMEAHATVFWSAKECLYKGYGLRQLDFRKHIFITPFAFNPEGGTISGRVEIGDIAQHYQLQYQFWKETYILVFAVLAD